MDRQTFFDEVVPFDPPPLPPSLPPIEVSGLVPPPLAPLRAEDVEHYRWLIDGLLRGVALLIEPTGPDIAFVAIDATRNLFDDLVGRIVPEEVR